MLEWTGERFLPWLDQATIAYEHLHRYAYATTFARGKRVLDLASGEGYGSKMMSAAASAVVGIDADEKSIEHAKLKYGSEKLQFLKGSITAVPITEDHSFDVIVCFEAIEHIEDHDQLLKEVKRLLKPDGIFIVSTPNKLTYHDEARDENPFHLKELYFDEFRRLLTAYFRNVILMGQRIHPSSTIWQIGTLNAPGIEEIVIERGESEFQFISGDKRVPLYFIAIACDSTLDTQHGSVLVDHSDELFREKRKAIEWRDHTIALLDKAGKWHEEQIANQEKAIAALEEAVSWRSNQIEELNKGLEWSREQIADMKEKSASDDRALEWRAGQVERLEEEKRSLSSALQSAQRQLEAIYASSIWKLVVRMRHVRETLRRLTGPGKSREEP